MTRNPLPRYVTTVSLTVAIAANDAEQAEARLNERIADEILDRLRKTTFTRLPGRPEVTYLDWNDFTEA